MEPVSQRYIVIVHVFVYIIIVVIIIIIITIIIYLPRIYITGWRRGVVVNTLVSINTVALHRARLLLGWVTA